VAAAMTQQPDLFRAVLCQGPLLDMLRYHKFGYGGLVDLRVRSADVSETFHTERLSFHRVRVNSLPGSHAHFRRL